MALPFATGILSSPKRPRSPAPCFLPAPHPASSLSRGWPPALCPPQRRVPAAPAPVPPRATLFCCATTRPGRAATPAGVKPAAGGSDEPAGGAAWDAAGRGGGAGVAAAAEVGGQAGDGATTLKRRTQSEQTKRKIASSMLGRRKSDEMRAKVSAALKGRVPWNKGKKLSPETCARMSEARNGRMPWNKGRALSPGHRSAISTGSLGVTRAMSEATRSRMRMARRRPGDAIVAGSVQVRTENGAYPLVETTDINLYVTLRRELRAWSDQYAERNGRRPSLADVRRVAPPDVIGKFERYTAMRDRIRGLAADVYGTINPEAIPAVKPERTASSPQNNNQGSVVQFTSHGNARLVPKVPGNADAGLSSEDRAAAAAGMDGDGVGDGEVGTWGQWDVYDRPTRGDYSSGFQVSEALVHGPEEAAASGAGGKGSPKRVRKDHLSANDYRAIGKYRLMESVDINRYVQLRRDLLAWSAAYKETHGHTPSLSDVRASGKPRLYIRFCEYIETRDRMDGLVKEVCGAEIDDVQQIQEAGRALVDQLRPVSAPDTAVSPPPPPPPPQTPLERAKRLKSRSPPSIGELQ